MMFTYCTDRYQFDHSHGRMTLWQRLRAAWGSAYFWPNWYWRQQNTALRCHAKSFEQVSGCFDAGRNPWAGAGTKASGFGVDVAIHPGPGGSPWPVSAGRHAAGAQEQDTPFSVGERKGGVPPP